MFLLISEGCTQFFFPFKEEPFDWPTTNLFGIWGTPQHRSLDKLPSPIIEARFVMHPLTSLFPPPLQVRYVHGS